MPKDTGDDHDTAPVVWVVDAPGGGYVESPDIEGRVVGPHGTVRLVIVPDDERDRLPRAACDYMILWHRVPLTTPPSSPATPDAAPSSAPAPATTTSPSRPRAAGTSVFHIPHYGTEEVADHTLALFLAQVRRLPDLRAHVRDGGWDWRSITDAPRVRGMTWGIVGLGCIGLAVAQRARALRRTGLLLRPAQPPRRREVPRHRTQALPRRAADGRRRGERPRPARLHHPPPAGRGRAGPDEARLAADQHGTRRRGRRLRAAPGAGRGPPRTRRPRRGRGRTRAAALAARPPPGAAHPARRLLLRGIAGRTAHPGRRGRPGS
ncbi:hypothetical protein LT493_16535 [Streptomyces tricolor]|nr:hypothetical protein [Streptomyces tricolor]